MSIQNILAITVSWYIIIGGQLSTSEWIEMPEFSDNSKVYRPPFRNYEREKMDEGHSNAQKYAFPTSGNFQQITTANPFTKIQATTLKDDIRVDSPQLMSYDKNGFMIVPGNKQNDEQSNGHHEDHGNGPNEDHRNGPYDDHRNGAHDEHKKGPHNDHINGPHNDHRNVHHENDGNGHYNDHRNGPHDDYRHEPYDYHRNGPYDDHRTRPHEDNGDGSDEDHRNRPYDDHRIGPYDDHKNGAHEDGPHDDHENGAHGHGPQEDHVDGPRYDHKHGAHGDAPHEDHGIGPHDHKNGDGPHEDHGIEPHHDHKNGDRGDGPHEDHGNGPHQDHKNGALGDGGDWPHEDQGTEPYENPGKVSDNDDDDDDEDGTVTNEDEDEPETVTRPGEQPPEPEIKDKKGSLLDYLPMELFKQVHRTLVENQQKTISGKLEFLRSFRSTLLNEIESRITALATPNRVKRGSGWEDDHVGFPSVEGALLAISFLTFAVYLVQLVMMLFRNLAATPTATNAVFVNRNKRSSNSVGEDTVRILQHLEEFTINHKSRHYR